MAAPPPPRPRAVVRHSVGRAAGEVNRASFSQRDRASGGRPDAVTIIGLRPRALWWWIFAAACGGSPADATIDIVHDVCAPISISVHAPSPAQRAGIDGALALWRDQGIATVIVVEAGASAGESAAADGAGAAIDLQFEAAGRPFHGLYDDHTSTVYINSAIADPQPLSIVIAHELGHSFGLPHIAAALRRSLMNPGNFVTPPTDADRAAIEALWGTCEPPPSEPR
jgi:hypothetical protein